MLKSNTILLRNIQRKNNLLNCLTTNQRPFFTSKFQSTTVRKQEQRQNVRILGKLFFQEQQFFGTKTTDQNTEKSNEIIEKLNKESEEGNIMSQYALGICYLFGDQEEIPFEKNHLEKILYSNKIVNHGIQKNIKKGIELIKNAASEKHDFYEAKKLLGIIYLVNYGEIENNKKKGILIFEKLIEETEKNGREQENLELNYLLARFYLLNSKSDNSFRPERALEILTKNAERNHQESIYHLSLLKFSPLVPDIRANAEEASKLLEKLVELNKNHVKSIYSLVIYHYYGHDEYPGDIQKALRYLDCLKEVNWEQVDLADEDSEMLLFFGKIYSSGERIEKDLERASFYFNIAAEMNNVEAQYRLALFYFHGFHFEVDKGRAMEYFCSAAKEGHSPSQYYLGLCYLHGIVVDKDLPTAFHFFEFAAASNFPPALFQMALCYQYSLGVPADLRKAFEMLEKAAALGFVNAENQLGGFYFFGLGVEKNYDKAFLLFERAAEKNHSEAQSNVALCYLHGRGVKKDLAKAVEYFKKSSAANFPEGQCNLAFFYLTGEIVGKDHDKAFLLFNLASEQGHVGATYFLALCYCMGVGTTADVPKGTELLQKCRESILFARFTLESHTKNEDFSEMDIEETANFYRKCQSRLDELSFNVDSEYLVNKKGK